MASCGACWIRSQSQARTAAQLPPLSVCQSRACLSRRTHPRQTVARPSDQILLVTFLRPWIHSLAASMEAHTFHAPAQRSSLQLTLPPIAPLPLTPTPRSLVPGPRNRPETISSMARYTMAVLAALLLCGTPEPALSLCRRSGPWIGPCRLLTPAAPSNTRSGTCAESRRLRQDGSASSGAAAQATATAQALQAGDATVRRGRCGDAACRVHKCLLVTLRCAHAPTISPHPLLLQAAATALASAAAQGNASAAGQVGSSAARPPQPLPACAMSALSMLPHISSAPAARPRLQRCLTRPPPPQTHNRQALAEAASQGGSQASAAAQAVAQAAAKGAPGAVA